MSGFSNLKIGDKPILEGEAWEEVKGKDMKGKNMSSAEQIIQEEGPTIGFRYWILITGEINKGLYKGLPRQIQASTLEDIKFLEKYFQEPKHLDQVNLNHPKIQTISEREDMREMVEKIRKENTDRESAAKQEAPLEKPEHIKAFIKSRTHDRDNFLMLIIKTAQQCTATATYRQPLCEFLGIKMQEFERIERKIRTRKEAKEDSKVKTEYEDFRGRDKAIKMVRLVKKLSILK